MSSGADDFLVNSVRPWLGARAAGYPSVEADFGSQHRFHEERIGRSLDIAHAFAGTGKVPFSDPDVIDWATRGEGFVLHNWKPAAKWRDACGGVSEVDDRIDEAAESVKALAPGRHMLVVHHEPENDVGRAGSVQEYRGMWANVRARFDAAGVDNVVWVMAYMNYPKWADLVVPLYPGKDLVDWVMFNAYGSAARPWLGANIQGFLDLLTQVDTLELGLADKPLGIIEWGISGVPQATAVSYYRQALEVIDKRRFPQVKAWVVFDSPGTHADGGLRIGFDDAGSPDRAKAESYRRFAQYPAFTSE